MKLPPVLREGFTTGSAATAAAVAAFRARRGGVTPDAVTLLRPGGGQLTVPVATAEPGRAVVIKDGGDDPDVTSGAAVVVTLREPPFAADPRDYVEPCGAGVLTLRGGVGVGVVTRPGLAVPVGHWAINPGPRRMLRENLRAAGFGSDPEALLVEISVPKGVELAAETLNPTLGICGGISILGNSGIVRPYSHAAYAATICWQLRQLGVERRAVAALVTGNRSAAAIQRDYPDLAETQIVRIGDYIQVAVRAAARAGLRRLIIGCMAGKLFKYACGLGNTHAHRTRQELARLREFVAELPPGAAPERCSGMSELAAAIGPEAFRRVVIELVPAAKRVLRNWGPELELEFAVYDETGERIE